MAARARLSRRIGAAAIAAAAGGGILLYGPTFSANDRGEAGAHESAIRQRIADPNVVVPSRATQSLALIGANSANPLDLLVVGGGATGTGVALDAVTRGLRVGLVEREDFASGTSSRSTKLIHGGTYVFVTCMSILIRIRISVYVCVNVID